MAELVVVNKEDLVAIADAVRAVTGSTETFTVSELSQTTVSTISNGTNAKVDATLTQEGMAADAKAVGDALVKIRKDNPYEKVLLYYGVPAAINDAITIDGAVTIYKDYDIVILGDEYNDPSHEDYATTVQVIQKIHEANSSIRVVGYVPIGADPSIEDSNLTMDEMKERVNWWINLGVNGIFLDEFGYDYYVTRERQNEIVQYCHDNGLFIFANAWNIQHVFSSDALVIDWLDNFEANPNQLMPLLDNNDYYLFENLFSSVEQDESGNNTIEGSSAWRIDDIMKYYTEATVDGKSYYDYYGTKVCALNGIASDATDEEALRLRTLAAIGSAILNVHALAFGDEHWGSTGSFVQWDKPELDLATNGLNYVTVNQKSYTDDDGSTGSFPYKWSTMINGRTYSIVFDLDHPDNVAWSNDTRYVTMNGIVVENAWLSVFNFQTEIAGVKDEVQTIADDTIARVDSAMTRIDSVMSDVEALSSGITFKEVQW